MMSEYDCLLSPVMTEKSMKNENGIYAFKVHYCAAKSDVKRAVEKVFNVKVSGVNILNRNGKKKTFRGKRGETQGRKIAFVRLSEGTINYEGGI